MKPITTAIQAILDADTNHPVTTVVITLNDGTVLYLADRDVTISSQAYTGDLMSPPKTISSVMGGIDHTIVRLNNTDLAYSSYNNSDLFDGADAVVSQWFSTDGEYTTFLGPVLAFGGKVSQPESAAGRTMDLTIMADARVSSEGAVGRPITGRCLNDFGDAACGYDYSATIATTGTYVEDADCAIKETLLDGQKGKGTPIFGPRTATRSADPGEGEPRNRIIITRGGATIHGESTPLYVKGHDFRSNSAVVRFNRSVALQEDDRIEYLACTKDSMTVCMARWQVGSVARQQDNFAGFSYYREAWPSYHSTKIGANHFAGMRDGVVPVMYGSRWIDPVLMGAHAQGEGDPLMAWQDDSVKGPIVFALISEGEVDTGIVDAETDVELDGILATELPAYDGDVASSLDTKVGTPTQAVSDFAPLSGGDDDPEALRHFPALPAFRNVAYTALVLPEDYEIGQDRQESRGPFTTIRAGTKEPGLRFRAKGRVVYTWTLVAGTPTKSGSRSYSTNAAWCLLDVLTSPFRIADSDVWSLGLLDAEVNLTRWIRWAEYCGETITTRLVTGADTTAPRYEANLYFSSGDRSDLVGALLDVMRASLTYSGGLVGIALDAPVGGKGDVTSATADSLTDSARSDDDQPTIPSWPVGILEGLKVKILDGTGAGQVRTIDEDNTADTIVPTVSFSPAPDDTSTYAIYAVELTEGNVGDVTTRKITPSHDLTNRLVVGFELNDGTYRGVDGSIPIVDGVVDGNGDTHADRFGVNEDRVDLLATTSWQQASRQGWYQLRKGMDTNRVFRISDVNVEGLPLEVGDIILLSHDIDGISNEVVRVERLENTGAHTMSIDARLYREHIYADWPTDDVGGLEISSSLASPHSVPPNVTDLAASTIYEEEGATPLVKLSYTLPSWQYAGWHVLVEMRFLDSESAWTPWEQVAISKTATAAFRAALVADYEIRAVFVSHVGIRSDAAQAVGTSSGSNSSTTLNDTSKTWLENQWAGATVLITGGTSADEESVVQSNTDAEELTVSPAWSVTPDNTSTYMLYDPAPYVSVTVLTEGASVLGLDNFRQIEQSATETVYGWDAGALVDTVWVFRNLAQQPVTEDPWPGVDSIVTDVLPASTEEYTIPVPPQGYTNYVQFQPMGASGVLGPVERAVVSALADQPDTIASLEVIVDDEDGSVRIRVDAVNLTLSYRYDYNVAATPAWPSDGEVEAGTIRTISASDEVLLPAGTVGLGERIRLRAAPYVNANGTGYDGTADHGDIKSAEDVRTKFRTPTLEGTSSEDVSGGVGTFEVTVVDPDDLADDLYYRTRQGSADWSAWVQKSGSPADETAYSEAVTTVEKHLSFVEFRLRYTLGGSAGVVHAKSSGFDKGKIPFIVIVPRLDEDNNAASAFINADYDTAKSKILARTDRLPTATEVRAATAVVGRNLTPSDIGVLASPTVGQTVFYGGFGYSSGDVESSELATAEAIFKSISPILRKTDESETGSTGLFEVTLVDPGGQADNLYFQTKSGTDDWTTWEVKSASPTETAYQETVTLIEGHQSYIRFRLQYTLDGVVKYVHAGSAGLDLGELPNITSVTPTVDALSVGSSSVIADFDTKSIKIAGSNSGEPSLATVQGEDPIDGNNLTPSDVGTLVASMEPGETLDVAALGYSAVSGGGVESELSRSKIVYNPVLGLTSVWLEDEMGTFEILPGPAIYAVRTVWLYWQVVSVQVASLKVDYNIDSNPGDNSPKTVNTGGALSGRVAIAGGSIFDIGDSANDGTYDATVTPYSEENLAGTAGAALATADLVLQGSMKVQDTDDDSVTHVGNQAEAGEGLGAKAGTSGPQFYLKVKHGTGAPPTLDVGDLYGRYV